MLSAETKILIIKAAENWKLEPATLMAVVEVESNGITFAIVNGRAEPLIRFEGHYFYKRLSGTKLETALKEGLASPKAGAVANPKTQSARWDLLARAIKIDEKAAYESTSWGIGQVMGAHWAWLGYGNADSMVEEARSGIEGQLNLMLRYINKAGLITALQKKAWETFAYGYNGPAYAANNYHIKLAKAYRLNSQSSDILSVPVNDSLKRGDQGNLVRDLQIALNANGAKLTVDGSFGGLTFAAVKEFQMKNGLSIDGIAGTQTLAALYINSPSSQTTATNKGIIQIVSDFLKRLLRKF